MTTTVKEAASLLLECIVYHDLANRRGETVADEIIAELASIADSSLDVQIEFLLSVTKDDEATIQRLEADLKESREYALSLEKELRDRANSQPYVPFQSSQEGEAT